MFPTNIQHVPAPPCSKCTNTDRMLQLPETRTDFGGWVFIWVCRRCGVVGHRPANRPTIDTPPRRA